MPPNGASKRTREGFEVRLDQPLEETIDRILRAALALEGGNRSRAARRLSIGLRTMQRFAARSRPGSLESANPDGDELGQRA